MGVTADATARMAGLRFAMVCASNMNRSMEAHLRVSEAGLNTDSYGVGSQVKVPGPDARSPNVYQFGVSYQEMYDDLKGKDEALYTRNGLLPMLERNIKIKRGPQRWQENTTELYDVVVTFEEHVFDKAVDFLQSREAALMRSVLLVNLDTKDDPKNAAIAAPRAVKLCQMLEESDEWEDEVDELMERFGAETGVTPIYQICFY